MDSIFYLEKQKHQNWCWAAVSAGIYRYLHPEDVKEQCEIASDYFTASTGAPADCCSNLQPGQLNPEKLQDILSSMGVFKSSKGPMEFDDLKAQLDLSLPVCARIDWADQGRGHFVTIIGYGISASKEEWIDVADPFIGYLCVPYQWFRHSYQDIGTWSDSFLIQAPHDELEHD